jgi:hypothetical protein
MTGNFCHKTAETILNTLGEEKAGLVISAWDDLGVKGCLDAERTLVVEEFTKLLTNLSSLSIPHSEIDDNLLLTAFVQEFERRWGQKENPVPEILLKMSRHFYLIITASQAQDTKSF